MFSASIFALAPCISWAQDTAAAVVAAPVDPAAVGEQGPLVFLLLALAALVLGCVFTMAQTAVAGLGPLSIQAIEAGKSAFGRRARAQLKVLPALEYRFHGSALLMLFLMCLFAGEAGLQSSPSPVAGAISGVFSALILQVLIVEVFARSLALSNPRRFYHLTPIAMALSLPVAPITKLIMPTAIVRTRDTQPGALSDMHLRLLPSLAGVERVLDEEAFDMIDSVRDFAAATAQDVMTPRTEVEGIPRDMPADQVYDRLRISPFSRLVVYEGSLDQVVGTLLAKEVLLRKPEDPFSLLRDPLIASEKSRLPELLTMIRANRSHLVLIMDEYGGLAGIVTLHDLFESIVGHIEDVEDKDEQWLDRLDHDRFRINGRVELWELNEETGLDLDEARARTISGYILKQLGRPPLAGEEMIIPGARVKVEEVTDNRVESLLLTLAPESKPPGVRANE